MLLTSQRYLQSVDPAFYSTYSHILGVQKECLLSLLPFLVAFSAEVTETETGLKSMFVCWSFI